MTLLVIAGIATCVMNGCVRLVMTRWVADADVRNSYTATGAAASLMLCAAASMCGDIMAGSWSLLPIYLMVGALGSYAWWTGWRPRW